MSLRPDRAHGQIRAIRRSKGLAPLGCRSHCKILLAAAPCPDILVDTRPAPTPDCPSPLPKSSRNVQSPHPESVALGDRTGHSRVRPHAPVIVHLVDYLGGSCAYQPSRLLPVMPTLVR